MQFIKKNYEKIMLGLVLLGLVGAVAFMFLVVASEKASQVERRTTITTRPIKPLPPPETGRAEALIRAFQMPRRLDFSTTNKLFNPVLWLKPADGKPVPAQDPLILIKRLQVTNSTPLYFTLTLTKTETAEAGPRFGLSVDHQVEGQRMGPLFVSAGEKKDYTLRGGKKQSFTLTGVEGAPENPVLIFQLNDSPEKISVTSQQPYRRVDGYTVEMRFEPDKTPFRKLRAGSPFSFAGEDYTVASITQSEVTLIARSNQKKLTVPYGAP